MAKVTVIIPVHRVDENLYRTIDSVLRQTHCDWELIVVNMGGVEQIDSFVEKYEDDRISFVDGDALSDNIDLVIARSSGEFFTIVHCGDVMHSAKMRIQLKRMTKNSDIAVCSTWMKPMSNDIMNMRLVGYEGYISDPMRLLLKNNFVYRSAAMVRRSFLRERGISFGRKYSSCGEYGLWFDISRCGGKIYVEPQYLTYLDTEEKNRAPVTGINESMLLRRDILDCLLGDIADPEKRRILIDLSESLERVEKIGLVNQESVLDIFYNILARM